MPGVDQDDRRAGTLVAVAQPTTGHVEVLVRRLRHASIITAPAWLPTRFAAGSVCPVMDAAPEVVEDAPLSG